MILTYFKNYSAILALPIVSAAIDYIERGTLRGVFGTGIIAFLITAICAVLSWRTTRISIEDGIIIAQNRFLISQNIELDASRASCITVKRGIFDFLLSSAAFRIKFNSQTPEMREFKIILTKNAANKLFYNLKHGVKLSGYVYFAAKKLYCQPDKIGIIKLSRTPIDKLRGKCKVRINVRNKSSDRLRMRNLSFIETDRKIKEYIKKRDNF